MASRDDMTVLAVAVAAVERTTGLTLRSEAGSNGESRLFIRRGDRQTTYRVAVGNPLIPGVRKRQREEEQAEIRLLAVSQYVSPGLADTLRQEHVEFIDTAGNAYLELDGDLICVKGETRPKRTAPSKPESSLTRPAELQVIFHYLAKVTLPEPADRILPVTLEALAGAAGVSRGSAANARNGMEQTGYLIRLETGTMEVVDRKRLLDLWARGFGERLRPKLLLDRLEPLDSDYWRDARLPKGVHWGGEIAAARLTHYLSPAAGTLYVSDWPNSAVPGLGLRRAADGAVEVRRHFWNDSTLDRGDCVHPLLVYADLLASDDPRNLDTAHRLYERYLAEHIEDL